MGLGELRFVGDQQRDVPKHLDDARGGIVCFVCCGWRGGQPTPKHLGDKMFLGGEIGIRGGRPDTRLSGHPPHGQTGEALPAQELNRGATKAVDGVGLPGGQTAPSRLQSRIGHVSGRYYSRGSPATVSWPA